MTIERFTQLQFELALPTHKKTGKPLCECQGLVNGELQYFMRLDAQSGIVIRSSIDRSGVAAATGEDSIRAWLVDDKGQPLGSKVTRWTTRQPGWGDRLKKVLRELWHMRKSSGNCPICSKPKGVFKVKKDGDNKGRLFAKCEEHNGFAWLED